MKRAGVLLLLALPGALNAQAWNAPRALDLVRRATDRRVQQLADSGLAGYQATAHGYLTFLAQLGEGFRELPRVVKADELALEVYWRAPGLSKQRVIGRRDTTLLPTDIAYHRDHLGIIQNEFPAVIRLGEGDEVSDVPHPLSPAGLNLYDFALTDSLRITSPGRVIDVYEIRVRPRDERQARFVGAVYLDRETARVARMAFSFTRAAYIDKQLDEVFIVLENGLVGSRFWLPRHQEVEIRRSMSWLDYPVRGVIRGRWDIENYVLNEAAAPIPFIGPEITIARPEELARYQWPPGRIADSLPEESRIASTAEVKRAQDEARAIAGTRALSKSGTMLGAHGVADLVRFDRNAGLSIGSGLTFASGAGLLVNGRGRFGTADRRWHGTTEIGWRSRRGPRIAVRAMNDTRDAGDVAERSSVVNTLAAQEFASDFTDQYGVSGYGAVFEFPVRRSLWAAEWFKETSYGLSMEARAFNGSLPSAFEPLEGEGQRLELRGDIPTTQGWGGISFRSTLALRTWWNGEETSCLGPCPPSFSVSRLSLSTEFERPLGSIRLDGRLQGGAALGSGDIRPQDLAFLGGPVSAPGFGFHELVGQSAASMTVGVQVPTPFPRIGLGRFGGLPASAKVRPHWTSVWLQEVPASRLIRRVGVATPLDPLRPFKSGWYHSAGVTVVIVADLVTLDASRALRGGPWRFSFDINRAFWSVL